MANRTAQYETNMRNDKGRVVGDEAAMLAEALRHYGVTDRRAVVVTKYGSGGVSVRARGNSEAAWLWYRRTA